jgi:hypothetical protein
MKACGGLESMVTAIAGSCRDGWQELPAAWHGRTERDDGPARAARACSSARSVAKLRKMNFVAQLCA